MILYSTLNYIIPYIITYVILLHYIILNIVLHCILFCYIILKHIIFYIILYICLQVDWVYHITNQVKVNQLRWLHYAFPFDGSQVSMIVASIIHWVYRMFHPTFTFLSSIESETIQKVQCHKPLIGGDGHKTPN